ncbi:hypothetical protein [Streptomyces sp. c-19]|uniref:hypothetical protein n=1 Tax=Streptomyces sp. c-19 TaxID=2789275 RepID=UPI00398042FA
MSDRPVRPVGRVFLTHAPNQPEGKVERLGSLAHELTHVAAGDSYRNTDILLLCRGNLGKEEMRALAHERAAHAAELKGLLTDDMVTPRQRQLIDNKIDYLTKPGQLGKYVGGFKTQLLAENPEKAQALTELAKEEMHTSASLVEYDTVLTQLLVYLHAWQVPHAHPFHQRVRVLAEAQRNDRAEAARADA